MNPRLARLSALAACVALAAGVLTGCASPDTSSEPTPAPATPTETKTPTPQPEPDPTPSGATRLPATCAELLPAEVLRQADPRNGMLDFSREKTLERMRQEVGPLTMATLFDGEQQLYCSFGVPNSDAMGNIGVAVISEQAKTELISALRSSVYEEVEARDAEAAFSQGRSPDHLHTEDILIDGDVLIAFPHTIGEGFAESALAAIRAGN